MACTTETALLEGTYFQGYIQTSFSRLRAAFGSPGPGDDDGKIKFRWIVTFPDGTVSSVYDWKVDAEFMGADGMTRRDLRSAGRFAWSIGGHDKRGVWWVRRALAANR